MVEIEVGKKYLVLWDKEYREIEVMKKTKNSMWIKVIVDGESEMWIALFDEDITVIDEIVEKDEGE